MPADIESGSAVQPALQQGGLVLDFEPKFTTLQVKKKLIQLEWRKVEYSIGNVPIINGVSGRANPREVVAIMGPSGAGMISLHFSQCMHSGGPQKGQPCPICPSIIPQRQLAHARYNPRGFLTVMQAKQQC